MTLGTAHVQSVRSRPVPRSGHRSRQRAREAIIGVALRACAFAAIAGLVLIMLFVFRGALPVLFDAETMREANLTKFTETWMWQPVGDVPKYGLMPLVIGTLKVVIVAMIFAVRPT